jgi:DNA polymerase III epsilon subunit-like protein
MKTTTSFYNKPHFPELMIDIETLSTRHDAAIISIAAIFFNIDTKQIARPYFYEEIDHVSLNAFHQDPKTLAWWAKQEKPILNGSCTIENALQNLITYIKNQPPSRIWAKSPSFDCNIIKYACSHFDLEWPIPFWSERDVRTIQDIAQLPNSFTATHDAIEDCLSQIRTVIDAHDSILLK